MSGGQITTDFGQLLRRDASRMSSTTPDESSQPEPAKDFEFLKPIGRPVKRRKISHSPTPIPSPSDLPSRENQQTLDVFACTGVVYFAREYYQKLTKINDEFMSIIENGQDAQLTVAVGKEIAGKLENRSVFNMIETWEQVEIMWQKTAEQYTHHFDQLKKASERYMSAVNCFISVWEIKNRVLENLVVRIQKLIDALGNYHESSNFNAFEWRTISTFIFDDQISNQMVSQQDALLALTRDLFVAAEQMDPKGKLKSEWFEMRETRWRAKQYLLNLNVDVAQEIEAAREKCGNELSWNNAMKELCLHLRRWKEEYRIHLARSIKFFTSSSALELKIDGFFTRLLVYRIKRRKRTPQFVVAMIRLLCGRGMGAALPDEYREIGAGRECAELKKSSINFHAQCSLWSRLEAVKFVEKDGYPFEYWAELAAFLKAEGLGCEKRS